MSWLPDSGFCHVSSTNFLTGELCYIVFRDLYPKPIVKVSSHGTQQLLPGFWVNIWRCPCLLFTWGVGTGFLAGVHGLGLEKDLNYVLVDAWSGWECLWSACGLLSPWPREEIGKAGLWICARAYPKPSRQRSSQCFQGAGGFFWVFAVWFLASEKLLSWENWLLSEFPRAIPRGALWEHPLGTKHVGRAVPPLDTLVGRRPFCFLMERMLKLGEKTQFPFRHFSGNL